jgi:hypothetical protein
MKGAPARAIQDLAGHQDLATTQRYMHLSPAALDAAIRLLESDAAAASRGAQGRGGNGGPQGPYSLKEVVEAAESNQKKVDFLTN